MFVERSEGQKRVLKAARALIVKNGYAAVSLRNIAAAAKYSPAGLYAHFEGREAILLALASIVREELHAALLRARSTESDPKAQLVAMGTAYVGFALEHPAEFELLFRHTRSRRKSRDAVEPSTFDLLRDALGAMRPTATAEEIDLAGLGFWCTAHGLAGLRTSHLADFEGDWERWTRRVLEMQLGGSS